jgi:hypothetical protein
MRRSASHAFFPGVHRSPGHIPKIPAATAAPVRVLVPGAISIAKGLQVLEGCVADALERRSGCISRAGIRRARDAGVAQAPLSIRANSRQASWPSLSPSKAATWCSFPAQCPEIFSYTLSRALDSGCRSSPPASARYPSGWRLAAGAHRRLGRERRRAERCARLRRAQASRHATPARGGFDEYLRATRWSGRGEVRSPPSPPAIEAVGCASLRRRPIGGRSRSSTRDGVVCGRASSLEGLRKLAFDPDSLHATTERACAS